MSPPELPTSAGPATGREGVRPATEADAGRIARIYNEGIADRVAVLGFREVGTYRRHAQLDGRWRDCVVVEKLLGPAAA